MNTSESFPKTQQTVTNLSTRQNSIIIQGGKITMKNPEGIPGFLERKCLALSS